MLIGVLADTHIPKRAKVLPKTLLDAFGKADHIIHAGDIQSADVIARLEDFAPVTAVSGNADPPGLKETLKEREIVNLGGFMFGVFHGHGAKGSTRQRAAECFRDESVDCIVFGHSHMPLCAWEGSVLLFNPGSPTDKRRNPYYSFGLIETGDALSPRINYFDAKGAIL